MEPAHATFQFVRVFEKEVLESDKIMGHINDVVVVKLTDKPGELSKLATIMKENNNALSRSSQKRG